MGKEIDILIKAAAKRCPHSLKNFLFPPCTTLLETIGIRGD